MLHYNTPGVSNPYRCQSFTCQRVVAVRWWRDVNPDGGSGDGYGLGLGGNEGGHLWKKI